MSRTFAGGITKTRRIEELALDGDAAKAVAGFLSALAADDALDAVPNLCAGPPRRGFDGPRVRAARDAVFGAADDGGDDAARLPRPSTLDLMASAAEWKTEGSDEVGHRVTLSLSGASGHGGLPIYTVRDGSRTVVLAGPREPEVLGEEALRRLAKGDAAGATQWLKWAAPLLYIPPDGDTLSVPPFLLFWGDHPPSDSEHLRFAAAALAAQGAGAAAAVPVLEAGAARATQSQEKFRFDRALAEAYRRTGRWDDLILAARRVRAQVPTSRKALLLEADGLVAGGRWDEVDKLVAGEIAKHPDSEDAARIRLRADSQRRRWAQQAAALRPRVRDGKADAEELNDFAWSLLMKGDLSEEALAAVERASQMSRYRNAAVLHTLATLQAEMGHPDDARETILKEIDVRDGEDLRSAEWYVFGRIAEAYGETAHAAVVYRRIVETRGAGEDGADDILMLAKRRLAALTRSDGSPGNERQASAIDAPRPFR